MTEVTSYPNPHHLGGTSRRLLAPAHTPRAPFFSPEALCNMSFLPPANTSYSGPQRPPLGARSVSVSSSSSSTSYNGKSSRTLSPALSASDPVFTGAGTVARGHRQQHLHRPSYISQTQAPLTFQSPSQYLQPQVGPQFTLSRPFPQASYFSFRPEGLPQLPSTMSFQPHPPVYPSFTAPVYHPSPELIATSYHHLPLVQLRDQFRSSIFAEFPAGLLLEITNHLGYLDIVNLSSVNKWFHKIIDPSQVPEEKKLAGVRKAERKYKRYFPRTSIPEAGQGKQKNAAYQPDSLGCYHCYRIKGPSEFELFKYNALEETEDGDMEATTPSQQPVGLPAPKSTSSSNPHYDPFITGSSIAASNRGGSSANPAMMDQSSPRIKETWGIRRFCIECGVKRRYYRPGALIELRSEKSGKDKKSRKEGKEAKEAKWICNCLKIHKKPDVLQCRDCGLLTPFSQHRGRY